MWEVNLKSVWILIGCIICLLLTWCWSSWTWNSSFTLNEYWFELNYDGKTRFEKVWLKTDDLDEIVDLYQEVGNNLKYRDSLLVAEKYAQWLWANAFSQNNLDFLEDQWLTLSNIKKTQIWLKKRWERVNAVLVEYEITEWLVNDIPLLYVSQIFVPKDNDMILMSFITEDQTSHSSVSNMFKNIR